MLHLMVSFACSLARMLALSRSFGAAAYPRCSDKQSRHRMCLYMRGVINNTKSGQAVFIAGNQEYFMVNFLHLWQRVNLHLTPESEKTAMYKHTQHLVLRQIR